MKRVHKSSICNYFVVGVPPTTARILFNDIVNQLINKSLRSEMSPLVPRRLHLYLLFHYFIQNTLIPMTFIILVGD